MAGCHPFLQSRQVKEGVNEDDDHASGLTRISHMLGLENSGSKFSDSKTLQKCIA